MNETEAKTLVLSLLDATGVKKILTSISATLLSFGVMDALQAISVMVGIVAGCMAIRHYTVATKLEQAKLNKFNDEQSDAT
ncbi:hypothetical protein VSAK1_13731 [Vibrio mediterranei AK1]|uniref:hypothetical protein n=1 Tax=Vibrio mediterranei TaxID=689 RepID=UPI000154235E|nr:hypothetical protein [Vibrio mediterranei]EDL52611.1 hypothetical protein VSAK1_13731 [Vibrio mediterranei AK1]